MPCHGPLRSHSRSAMTVARWGLKLDSPTVLEGNLSLAGQGFAAANYKAGIWMFHCHIDEQMEMGMMAMYQVQP